MKKRILTLCLYPNAMQKRYLKNQYVMTLLFYQSECNYIMERQKRGEVLKLITIQKHVYRKKALYLPNLCDEEAKTMCDQLYQFQKQYVRNNNIHVPNTYIVKDALIYYHWRNVDIFRCIRLHHTWQKEVFRKDWKLLHSTLIYQQGRFYMTLDFVYKNEF